MRAVVYFEYGSPDVLRLAEVPTPSPRPNEVLIRVHASTVNRTDCGFLRGKPFITRFFSGLTRPKHTILGNEFAGRIEAIGAGVTEFKVGDDVFGYDDSRFGGHAEYLTMPESGILATIPANTSYEEAAPITEGSHYALSLIHKADVRSGQRVLINGASGGIGSAGLQLMKHLDAEVTAVTSTRNLELVRSLGADQVIDYLREDFTKSGETYDLVFDAVGKSTFARCKPLLKPGGIYASSELGPRWQNPFLALWTSRFGDKKVIFPIPTFTKEDILFFKKLVEQGEFRPVIDRTYPLEQVPEAFRYVEQGHKVGNVVITVVRTDET